MATESTSSNEIEYYRWVTRGKTNCPLCARLEGEIMTREEWSRTILPGFHENCDCTLVLDHVQQEYTVASSNILMKLDPDLLSRLKESIASVLLHAEAFFISIGAIKRLVSSSNADPVEEEEQPHNPGGGSVNVGGSTPGTRPPGSSTPGSTPGTFRPQR